MEYRTLSAGAAHPCCRASEQHTAYSYLVFSKVSFQTGILFAGRVVSRLHCTGYLERQFRVRACWPGGQTVSSTTTVPAEDCSARPSAAGGRRYRLPVPLQSFTGLHGRLTSIPSGSSTEISPCRRRRSKIPRSPAGHLRCIHHHERLSASGCCAVGR